MLEIRPHVRARPDVRALVIGRRRGAPARRIGQHQRVLAVAVAEVVADPFVLHQPADEVEVGLPVLHAVVPLAVGAGELELEVGRAAVAEHLLDDVGDLHRLEDAAVGGAREEPQPRTHLREVLVVAPVLGALREPRHVAVEEPRALAGQLQRDGDVLA